MTFDLFDLTYRVAREIGGGVLVEGVATGGSGTLLIDTVERTEADDYWNGGTAWIVEDAGGAGAAPEGSYSVVTDFVKDSATLTLRTTITAPAAGDRYALCKKRYPLQVLIQMINNALHDLGPIPYVDTSTITIAANQTEYTLPGAANLDLRQVWLQRQLNDSNDNEWVEIHNWEVARTAVGSADTLILPAQYTTGYAVKLVYMDYHPELRDVGDQLSETVHLDRVVYGAAAKCLRWYMDKTRLDDFETTYQRIFQRSREAKAEYPIDAPRKAGRLLVINDNNKYRRYPGDRTPR